MDIHISSSSSKSLQLNLIGLYGIRILFGIISYRPVGLKYEKAKEWKIPCVNAQWLCDVLLGNFEALRQIQHSRYSIYTHSEPLMPNPQLVQNLMGM